MSRCFLPTTFILLFFFSSASAQQFQYDLFDTRSGLPSAEIYDVEVDEKGLVWVATDRGVASYDGYDFKVYTTKEGLYSNSCLRFFKDGQGRLWIPSLNGRLTVKDENGFAPYRYNHKIDSLNPKGFLINLLSWDPDGNLIFSFTSCRKNLLHRIDKITGKVESKPISGWMGEYSTTVLGGEKWFTMGDHLFPSQRVDHCQYGNVVYFWENGASSTLYRCDLGCPTNLDSIQFPALISGVLLDPAGDLWVSTLAGMARFPGENIHQTPSWYLEDLAISNLDLDLDQRFWVTTLQKGLLCIPNFGIEALEGKGGKKISGTVVSLVRLGSSLLVSTMEGNLYEVDSSLQVRKLNPGSHKFGSLSFGLVQNGEALFSNFRVYQSGNSLKFESRKVENRDQVGFYSPRGFFVLAGSNRLVFYSKFPWEECKEFPRSSQRLLCAMPRENEVLLGTMEGILRMNEEDKVIPERLFPEEELFNCRINEILEDSEGNLLVATLGKGLLRRSAGQTFQVSTEDGLGSNLINRICLENDSVIWVAHNKGVDRVKLGFFKSGVEIKEISSLTNKDGLPTNFIRDVAFWKDKVWVGTGMGLWNFDPKKVLSRKNTAPPVHLEMVQVNQEPYPLSELAKLEHDQNDVSIRYTGITGKKPLQGAFYRYRLQGGDGAWRETNDRSVQFSNLAPGHYRFEVTACNQQGVWNPSPAGFSFFIAPHYSQTIWFKGGALGGMLLLFMGLSLLRVRQTRRKADQQRALDQAELKARDAELAFLRYQMNPHFVFNALNSIQNYIFRKDVLKANHYLTCFSRLMRNTLEFSREESITLKEEIEFQRAYLEMEKMRFPGLFSVEWDIESNLDPEAIRIPPLLCQPLLENAVKHAFHGIDYPGKIWIQFSQSRENFLSIVIRDNGKGINEASTPPKVKPHDSIGLGLVREQVERNILGNLQGRFKIKNLYRSDGAGAGLEVLIELPVGGEAWA